MVRAKAAAMMIMFAVSMNSAQTQKKHLSQSKYDTYVPRAEGVHRYLPEL